MSQQLRCPACRQILSKRYRRSLTNLEWQKLHTSQWMKAWENTSQQLGALLRDVTKERDTLLKKRRTRKP